MRKTFVVAAMLLIAAAAVQADVGPITSFEGYANGTEVMFQEPTYSGSTSGFMETTPNYSGVTDTKAHTGLASYKASWQWKAGKINPWLRYTTYNTPNLPNPTISFTDKLGFWILFEPVEGGPTALKVGLGVRETNTTAAIGANGGGTGQVEILGVTGGVYNPIRTINVSTEWQYVEFTLPTEPIVPLTGNGILESTTGKGVLESLAFAPIDASAVGPYTIYLDDFEVTPIPEPGSLLALGTGLVGLMGFALRRRRV